MTYTLQSALVHEEQKDNLISPILARASKILWSGADSDNIDPVLQHRAAKPPVYSITSSPQRCDFMNKLFFYKLGV